MWAKLDKKSNICWFSTSGNTLESSFRRRLATDRKQRPSQRAVGRFLFPVLQICDDLPMYGCLPESFISSCCESFRRYSLYPTFRSEKDFWRIPRLWKKAVVGFNREGKDSNALVMMLFVARAAITKSSIPDQLRTFEGKHSYNSVKFPSARFNSSGAVEEPLMQCNFHICDILDSSFWSPSKTFDNIIVTTTRSLSVEFVVNRSAACWLFVSEKEEIINTVTLYEARNAKQHECGCWNHFNDVFFFSSSLVSQLVVNSSSVHGPEFWHGIALFFADEREILRSAKALATFFNHFHVSRINFTQL